MCFWKRREETERVVGRIVCERGELGLRKLSLDSKRRRTQRANDRGGVVQEKGEERDKSGDT